VGTYSLFIRKECIILVIAGGENKIRRRKEKSAICRKKITLVYKSPSAREGLNFSRGATPNEKSCVYYRRRKNTQPSSGVKRTQGFLSCLLEKRGREEEGEHYQG